MATLRCYVVQRGPEMPDKPRDHQDWWDEKSFKTLAEAKSWMDHRIIEENKWWPKTHMGPYHWRIVYREQRTVHIAGH
jgi:hypothetical protein